LHDRGDVGEERAGVGWAQELRVGFGPCSHRADGSGGGNESTQKAGQWQTIARAESARSDVAGSRNPEDKNDQLP
jgi:hypothetical protein